MNAKIKFFDLTAPVYERLHFSMVGKTVDFLSKSGFFDPEVEVIDLAGGTGRVAEQIRPFVKKVTVIDASEPMLAVCRNKGIDAIRGLAEQLPFADNSVSRIMVIDAFHHFQDQPRVLQELRRVLKPGGQIFIEEVNRSGLFGRSLSFAENLLAMGSHFFVPAELEHLTKTFFSSVKIHHLNKNFFAIILKK